MRGRVREVVIYFKFHENRSRGLRAVEGRKSPSPIELAHGLYNCLYYCTSRDDCTCAIIARGFCYVRCTYFIHVVFVSVPLCFIFCMPCCEYCRSLPVTHMLLVVMLSPLGQWMFFH